MQSSSFVPTIAPQTHNLIFIIIIVYTYITPPPTHRSRLYSHPRVIDLYSAAMHTYPISGIKYIHMVTRRRAKGSKRHYIIVYCTVKYALRSAMYKYILYIVKTNLYIIPWFII